MSAEERLRDLKTDVVDGLDELEDQEEITEADLEAFRKRLPSDPTLAMLVDRWLPPPWDEVFEYVSGSERQPAYWRTKPDRRRARSPAERERNERFREAARQSEGALGTVDYDGREVPASAAITAETVRGETSAPRAMAASGRKALRRLRSVLGLDA